MQQRKTDYIMDVIFDIHVFWIGPLRHIYRYIVQ